MSYDSKLKAIKRFCNIDFTRVTLEDENNDICRKKKESIQLFNMDRATNKGVLN